jgi:acyl carrier protein
MADTFTRDAVEANLIEVFSKFKHGNVQVHLTSVITADLGVDSLAVMEIVAELEDTYDLTFPDEELPNVKTVGDVAGMIVRGLDEAGRLRS